MAKATLTADERQIILNALSESGVEESDLQGFAILSDSRLIDSASEILTNEDTDEDEDEYEDEDEDEDEDGDEEEFDEDDLTDNEEFDEDPEFEDFEDEELEEEAVTNMSCGSSMKKKKKKGMTMNRTLSAQEWLNSAPTEISEVVVNALAHAREQKAALIEKLTANLSGDKKRFYIRKLANNSLAQLQDIEALGVGTVARPRVQPKTAVHIGAGGVTANSKSENSDSAPLIPPTINWKDLKDEFSGN